MGALGELSWADTEFLAQGSYYEVLEDRIHVEQHGRSCQIAVCQLERGSADDLSR